MAKKAYIGVPNMTVWFECTLSPESHDCHSPDINNLPSPEDDTVELMYNVELCGVVYENVLFMSDGFTWFGYTDDGLNIEIGYDGYTYVGGLDFDDDPVPIRLYTGSPGGVARKIKKGYVGVDGVARKIKKAYIGIGGVARPCWSGGELAYYGTITPLSVARYHLSSNTTPDGEYALFAGGRNASNTRSVVDAYNKQLTRSAPEVLSSSRVNLASANVGIYTLFAGGSTTLESGASGIVDAYDPSLVRYNTSAYSITSLSESRSHLAGVSIGGYALFAGGSTTGKVTNTARTNKVDAYNSSLTRSLSHSSLSYSRVIPAGIGNGVHAFFAGGYGANGPRAEVEIYDTSLTKTVIDSLSEARFRVAAARVGEYVIFAGGSLDTGTQTTATVDAYDSSLTRTTLSELSVDRCGVLVTSHDKYAVFVGGNTRPSTSSIVVLGTVDVYDASLTRTTLTDLDVCRHYGAGATVGEFALFAGGLIDTDTSTTETVEAYTIA